ncbi:MAG: molybdopterin-dependent oxidoreductase [Bacteroidales bacterium]|nr:molybdopterin-dependent oxidoreductase [Bacteroidales bacterium]
MKQVNKSIPKIDGMGLAKGKPAFTDDLTDSNAIIVKVLRSPHAFARIKNINVDKAVKYPGVECVFTHKDVPRNVFTRAGQGYPEPSPKDKFILDEYVRYVGDEVAVVAATTDEIADQAMKLIEVEYEVFEAVLDFEKAENNKSVIHPEKESYTMFPMGFDASKNIACTYDMHIGDVDEVLKNSEVVLDKTYYTQAQAHVAIETHSSTAYIDHYERLNIITSTQTPVHLRRIIGEALGMPINKIRVVKPRVGGAFGGKQQIHGELFCALVTLKTGRPSKCIYSRKEVFESSFSRHAMRLNIKIGADKTGRLKAIDLRVLSDTGAYGEHALTVFMIAGSKTLPLYNKVEAVRFGGIVVYTNHTPGGAYRGYGAIQGNFALESAMDELADKLNIDPIQLREMNMIKEGETSEIFKIMGEGGEGTAQIIESCKLDYCLKRGSEMIKWNSKYLHKKINADKVRGIGMAIAMQGSGIPNMDMGAASLKLNDDGFFNLLIGATDLGTGSDTILAQIAAETLNVPVEDIVVYASDSDLTPFDCGAYASSTTFVSGNGVRKTAEKMKNLIISEGAKHLQINVEDTIFDGKTIKSKDGEKSISLKEISKGWLYHYGQGQEQLIASDSYVGKKSPPPYMAGFVEVEVDTKTGHFDILDYTAVVDCGTTINPKLALGQMEGGLLQGIGMAVYEDVKYNKYGQMLTNNLMNYKIPTREDVPNINVEFADSYEPSGPYGAKSVGEIGIDTPPAAISNAIFNAVGVRINDLPITPEKILMAMKKKEQKK